MTYPLSNLREKQGDLSAPCDESELPYAPRIPPNYSRKIVSRASSPAPTSSLIYPSSISQSLNPPTLFHLHTHILLFILPPLTSIRLYPTPLQYINLPIDFTSFWLLFNPSHLFLLLRLLLPLPTDYSTARHPPPHSLSTLGSSVSLPALIYAFPEEKPNAPWRTTTPSSPHPSNYPVPFLAPIFNQEPSRLSVAPTDLHSHFT